MAYMATRPNGTGSRHPAAQGFTTRERKLGARILRRREDRREAAGRGWEEEATRPCRGYNPDTGRWCEARVALPADHCAACLAYLQRMWDQEDYDYNWTKWEQCGFNGEYLS